MDREDWKMEKACTANANANAHVNRNVDRLAAGKANQLEEALTLWYQRSAV